MRRPCRQPAALRPQPAQPCQRPADLCTSSPVTWHRHGELEAGAAPVCCSARRRHAGLVALAVAEEQLQQGAGRARPQARAGHLCQGGRQAGRCVLPREGAACCAASERGSRLDSHRQRPAGARPELRRGALCRGLAAPADRRRGRAAPRAAGGGEAVYRVHAGAQSVNEASVRSPVQRSAAQHLEEHVPHGAIQPLLDEGHQGRGRLRDGKGRSGAAVGGQTSMHRPLRWAASGGSERRACPSPGPRALALASLSPSPSTSRRLSVHFAALPGAQLRPGLAHKAPPPSPHGLLQPSTRLSTPAARCGRREQAGRADGKQWRCPLRGATQRRRSPPAAAHRRPPPPL